MAGHYHVKPDPTLTAGWGIIARTGPDSNPARRRAHYYRDGYPVCGIRLHGMPYAGPLRAHRDLDSNCERCERVLNPRKRVAWVSYDSRQCHRCGRDYLYPAYGSPRGVCNDCLMSGRRRDGASSARRE